MLEPPKIHLSAEAQAVLEKWAQDSGRSLRLQKRARIILLAAEGRTNREIARNLGISRPTVQYWRKRFLALSLNGLDDIPRPGRPAVAPVIRQDILDSIYDHIAHHAKWTSRSIAEQAETSEATVRRIWKLYGWPKTSNPILELTGLSYYKLSQDVLALYINPPIKCLVIWEHKHQIMKPPRLLEAEEDHLRKRQRTRATILFEVLSRLEEQVPGDSLNQQKYQGFLNFLEASNKHIPSGAKLRLLASNLEDEIYLPIKRWLDRHPRFTIQMASAGSLRNFVQDRLKESGNEEVLNTNFASVPELYKEAKAYVQNQNPKPQSFSWILDGDHIHPQLQKKPSARMICSIKGCSREAYSLGICEYHYRLRKRVKAKKGPYPFSK
jgi:transposase